MASMQLQNVGQYRILYAINNVINSSSNVINRLHSIDIAVKVSVLKQELNLYF